VASATQSTATACTSLPSRRGENWSAATWTSAGTGRSRITSNVPALMCWPSWSTVPIKELAIANDTPLVPYRNITSGRLNPAYDGVCWKTIRITTASKPVITS
jgi:hypothetical protein